MGSFKTSGKECRMVPIDPNRYGPVDDEQPNAPAKPQRPVETCICWQGVEDSLIRFIEAP